MTDIEQLKAALAVCQHQRTIFADREIEARVMAMTEKSRADALQAELDALKAKDDEVKP